VCDDRHFLPLYFSSLNWMKTGKLSATDDVTRVASRRFLGKHFPQEIKRAARYERALSVTLCDIDELKKINDTLRHAAGDQVLQQFASRLK
jgi:diguanylate cyclase (GGDEF)-like protein